MSLETTEKFLSSCLHSFLFSFTRASIFLHSCSSPAPPWFPPCSDLFISSPAAPSFKSLSSLFDRDRNYFSSFATQGHSTQLAVDLLAPRHYLQVNPGMSSAARYFRAQRYSKDWFHQKETVTCVLTCPATIEYNIAHIEGRWGRYKVRDKHFLFFAVNHLTFLKLLRKSSQVIKPLPPQYGPYYMYTSHLSETYNGYLLLLLW